MDRGYFALRPENDLPATWDADAALSYTPGERATASKVAASTPGRFRKVLVERDTRARQRGKAVLVAQAFVRGLVDTPNTWPGVVGIGLSDGIRGLVLIIGDGLVITDVGGVTLATITPAGHRWDLRQHYRLEKVGRERWVVWNRERVVATFPYELAPLLSVSGVEDIRARASFGLFDAAGAGSAEFDGVIATANTYPPLPSEIGRFYSELPAATVPSVRWDAMAHAVAGLVSDVITSMERLWGEITAARETLLRAVQSKGVLPGDQEIPWGVTGSITLAREGWRMAATSEATQDLSALGVPTTAQRYVRAAWRVAADSTPAAGVSDDVGPLLTLAGAGKDVYARLFEDTSGVGTNWYWVLLAGPLPSSTRLGSEYRVNPYRSHLVELVLVPEQGALLKVDGRVVSSTPWTTLFNSALGEEASVSVDRNAWHVDRAEVRAAAFDLSLRAEYRRALADRLIPTTGCERNDVLERWAVDRWSLMAHRGTTPGIWEELRRLFCGADGATYPAARDDGAWILDKTFPDHDPVVFDADIDKFIRGGVELPAFAGMTLDDMARTLATYVLPLSAYEARYSIYRAELLTGPTSAPDAKTRRFPVADTSGFAVGDIVEVRAAAASYGEITQVTSIVADTHIDTIQTPSSYVALDVIRRKVAST